MPLPSLPPNLASATPPPSNRTIAPAFRVRPERLSALSVDCIDLLEVGLQPVSMAKYSKYFALKAGISQCLALCVRR